MHGVGIDQLEIERLERALARRPRLAERLFTAAERAYAAERARPAQHLAARFCAKEAVAKALGLEAWSFTDVEVVRGTGAPRVELHGAVARRAAELGVTAVHVSLTHTGRDAAAVAFAATDAGPASGAAAPEADAARGAAGPGASAPPAAPDAASAP